MSTNSEIKKYIEENWSGTIRVTKEDDGTLIGMPKPYSVSGFGNVFQEMYYWGTYFTNVGLIIANRVEQAKNNVDNMVYFVNRFGFVPNSNRTWGLVRSQPPFLSEMVKDVYEITKDKEWLKECYAAIKKEYAFWQEKRSTPSGLNTYSGEYPDIDFLCNRFCTRLKIDRPSDEETIKEYAKAFHTGCESGWDFSSRCGISQHHYAWLCLNSLLFGIEKNMEYFSKEIKAGEEEIWEKRASKRHALINELMWNDELGAFSDYDTVEKKKSSFISLAMLYPLFVGLASKEQAEKTVKKLGALEVEYGLTSTENNGKLMNLQWDFPHVWPPLQLISIKALLRYDFKEEARKVAEKYLKVVELNFEKYGRLWEKYDGVKGEISMTKEYETPPLMGWSAATYLYCDKILSTE